MKGPDGFVQASNAQIAVDDTCQLIVGQAVTQAVNDKRQLVPMIETVTAQAGETPGEVLADNGYCSEANLEYVRDQAIDAYIATDRLKHDAPLPPVRGRIPTTAPAPGHRAQLRPRCDSCIANISALTYKKRGLVDEAIRSPGAMTKLAERQQEDLFRRVAEIIEAARGHVARTVNAAMVQAYWLIGREIVEVDQAGKARARYGDRLVRQLAARLSERYGKGFSYPSIKRMKQFYLTFPHGSTIPAGVSGIQKGSATLRQSSAQKGSATLSLLAPGRDGLFPPALGWTHYQILIRVDDPDARSFYEIEAASEFWSSRELERQIASLLFERLAKSRDKARVLALAKKGNEVIVASDVIKDPFVLEFLDLPERHTWLERDLEQAIIDRIEDFLLELGKGFCFAARQKRLTLDGDHFYVDLVFYNRLLRCFVLVDLKLGKLTHQDLGQMQMYVNFFDRFQRAEHEAKTIGIVLCSEKNDAMVKITLPEDDEHVLAARYQMYLPTEEELRAELTRERREAEGVVRLAAATRNANDPHE